jgi:hypothetical protein
MVGSSLAQRIISKYSKDQAVEVMVAVVEAELGLLEVEVEGVFG